MRLILPKERMKGRYLDFLFRNIIAVIYLQQDKAPLHYYRSEQNHAGASIEKEIDNDQCQNLVFDIRKKNILNLR